MLAVLATQPGIGAPARRNRAKGLRRINLKRVRYYLYYRVSGNFVLDVLAFGTPVALDSQVFEAELRPLLHS